MVETSSSNSEAAEHFSERWRSSTTRLLLLYGLFFVVWSVLLVLAINWQTARYLETVVDQILEQRIHYLASVEHEKLPASLALTGQLDLRGVMSFGLFDANSRYVSGNIDHLPADLPADAQIHPLANGVQRINGENTGRSRGIALRLDDNSVIVLSRTTNVIDRVGELVRGGLLWALSLSVVPGLLGGLLLSRGPIKRARRIETAIVPIMRGDLSARVPVSERRDELDLLASVVNRMLDQLERLLGEVKSVSDSIAHDLRTPLTRLRAQLYRVQQQSDAHDPRAGILERCIADVDALLDRFRALLRISELEDFRRRAGFGTVDLRDTLTRVHELYAPVAEDKFVTLTLNAADTLPTAQADGELLFEALSNLVDNAIKFSPAQSTVYLRASREPQGTRVEIIDSGPGIAPEERLAVLGRFYRSHTGAGESGPTVPGHGLGLSIVAAILKLHDYRFEIASNEPAPGARVIIDCWPVSTPLS